MDLSFKSKQAEREPGPEAEPEPEPDVSLSHATEMDDIRLEIDALKETVPGMTTSKDKELSEETDCQRMASAIKELSDKLDALCERQMKSDTPRSSVSDDLESTISLGGGRYKGSKKKKTFDILVYDEERGEDSDNEKEKETAVCSQCNEELTDDDDGSWSNHKKHRLHRCLWKLKYNRIVSSFYLDSLKRREERWSWMIIVISTMTSGFTVANNVETAPFETYNIIVNTVLTTSSMMTSLIAAWIKKQKFVEKINEVDKYLIDINKLCEELEIQFSLLEDDRLAYKDFKKKYLPEITKFVSTNPMIPPNEWKDSVREITLKYPELVDPDNSETNKLWPWFGDLVKYTDEHGQIHNIRKPTTFMKYMKKTNKARILSSCCRKKRDCENVY